MTAITPVILSGGNGTRLWPLSRRSYPKQFLSLAGEQSMLQSTVLRAARLDGAVAPIVVCNDEHRFLVASQLRDIGVDDALIVLESAGRNTAPAAAVAALAARGRKGGGGLVLALPADHAVSGIEPFRRCVECGVRAASAGRLVTFGVEPRTAATGFGYIRAGGACDEAPGVFDVDEFIEKPPRTEAERYLVAGGYYWNSGMFLFDPAVYLAELEQHAPEMLASCRAAYQAHRRDLDFIRLEAEAAAGCPAGSIDHTIMEKTSRAAVVPLASRWNDIGSWDALHEAGNADDQGNVAHGDVLLEDTRDSYVHAERRLVAALGVDGHIIVETPDAVMVAPRARAQDVKVLVDRLRAEGRSEAEFHRRSHRPWGCYESIAASERYQVKHIVVEPGASLSLQMHHHRAEHWIIVRGTARVVCGDEQRLLTEGESTYVPVGTRHRLENPGLIPLELIEVQTGSYLGEDDIVRFDDRYGR